MFTGLVTDVGTVTEVMPLAAGRRFAIRCGYDPASIAIGASIACAGCCLTATTVAAVASGGAMFTVDASSETLERTTLGDWRAGTRVNLERSLRLGDELGGHLVTGHVDGIAIVAARAEEAEMARLTLRAPAALMPMIAEKGSVALDGTSLTVNGVGGDSFTVMMVPHTLAVTTWQRVAPGACVNLEVDMLARYVARLLAVGGAVSGSSDAERSVQLKPADPAPGKRRRRGHGP